MKAWKKGAIVGGVWGIVSYPIFFLFVYLWGWERSVPKFIEEGWKIVLNLPLIILQPIFKNFTESMALGLVLNLVGWILIGALLGFIYQKYRGERK